MIQQQGNALTFYAHYIAAKVSKTGLTVTVDVYEATTGTPIVSGASATELGGGLYYYTLASGSVDANGSYIAIFKTADTSVDQQHLPSIWQVGTTWVANLDTTISSRGSAANLALAQAGLDDILLRLPSSLIGGLMRADIQGIDGGNSPTGLRWWSEHFHVGEVLGGSTETEILVSGLNALAESDLIDNRLVAFDANAGTGVNWQIRRIVSYNSNTAIMVIDPPLPQPPANAPVTLVVLPLWASVDVTAVDGDTAAAVDLAANIANLDAAVSTRSTLTAAQVWANATRTLTSFGTLVADVWSYVTRTLTSGGGGATPAQIWDYLLTNILTTGSIGKLIKDKLNLITTTTEITVDSPINGGMLTITRAVSLDSGLVDVTVPAGWTKCYVTAKKDKDDEDSAALFQLVESNPGAGSDGLLRLNGKEVGANEGTLLVDEDNNQIQFTLTDNATAELKAKQTGSWDVKFLVTGGNSSRPVAGRLQVVLPVTQTI
jgi:hypothetical protein